MLVALLACVVMMASAQSAYRSKKQRVDKPHQRFVRSFSMSPLLSQLRITWYRRDAHLQQRFIQRSLVVSSMLLILLPFTCSLPTHERDLNNNKIATIPTGVFSGLGDMTVLYALSYVY
jgi:hypothetical protein